ncbi:MAG: DUF998 domain-containing protein [Ktedonobacterales bacterium]
MIEPPAPVMGQLVRGARSTGRNAARFGALVVAGVILYLLLDVVAQLLPPHYNPIKQAESDLGVGPYGWIMSLNFVVRGLIALALVAGLRRSLASDARPRLALALLLIWAAGDVLLAVFRTDVPPHRATIHGVIHLAVAFIAFVAVALGELILSLRIAADPRWAAIRPLLLTLACAALVVMVALFLHVLPRAQISGLIERVFLGLVLLWMVVAGLWLIHVRAA